MINTPAYCWIRVDQRAVQIKNNQLNHGSKALFLVSRKVASKARRKKDDQTHYRQKWPYKSLEDHNHRFPLL